MLESPNSYPWLFRQGLSPVLLLIIYVSLSCILFIFDSKYHSVDLVRKTITLVVEPLQRLVQIPETIFIELQEYFTDLNQLQAENKALKTKHLLISKDTLRLQQIQAENARLRQLLLIKEQQTLQGEVAQILYTARDPFSKKVIINKGDHFDNLQTGQAVIDEKGVVGQITKTFPFSSEVTLITDKNQSIYTKIRRTGQRAMMFGLSNGLLDLRYVPHHMDVKVGDILETSGLDNVYPAGFPVAKVVKVDRNSAFAFTQIHCEPLAAVENSDEVLVLNKLDPLPDYPTEENSQEQDSQENSEKSANDNENNNKNKNENKKDLKENTAENKVENKTEKPTENKNKKETKPENNSTNEPKNETKNNSVTKKDNEKKSPKEKSNENKNDDKNNKPENISAETENKPEKIIIKSRKTEQTLKNENPSETKNETPNENIQTPPPAESKVDKIPPANKIIKENITPNSITSTNDTPNENSE